jgi:hypothetical protein
VPALLLRDRDLARALRSVILTARNQPSRRQAGVTSRVSVPASALFTQAGPYWMILKLYLPSRQRRHRRNDA